MAQERSEAQRIARSLANTTSRASYPTVLMMDFIWDQPSRASFSAQNHRARWLRCNALINRPPAQTPLYALQYVDHARAPIYTTPVESLVIIATDEGFYLPSTVELEANSGRWDGRKSWRPSGPDPQHRLDTVPFLFDLHYRTTVETQAKYEALQAFSAQGIEDIYAEVMRRCKPVTGDLPPTMTASELASLIPRGPSPVCGSTLGALLPTSHSTALTEAPSRRGLKRKLKGAGEGTTARPSDQQTTSVGRSKARKAPRKSGFEPWVAGDFPDEDDEEPPLPENMVKTRKLSEEEKEEDESVALDAGDGNQSTGGVKAESE